MKTITITSSLPSSNLATFKSCSGVHSIPNRKRNRELLTSSSSKLASKAQKCLSDDDPIPLEKSDLPCILSSTESSPSKITLKDSTPQKDEKVIPTSLTEEEKKEMESLKDSKPIIRTEKSPTLVLNKQLEMESVFLDFRSVLKKPNKPRPGWKFLSSYCTPSPPVVPKLLTRSESSLTERTIGLKSEL
eukprot:TRINITY_DN4966_c0_g1_i1.p1 TRINITY_DN4966_c0_g1~~TRINITY_DN4966_c0_g1_i1.p1  ORF type:complete len:189 (-),score=54.39 TRINITY_DN4966_c0_g1_i1:245-811(-)